MYNNPLGYTDPSGHKGSKLKGPIGLFLEGLRIGQYGSYEGNIYNQYVDDHDIDSSTFLDWMGIGFTNGYYSAEYWNKGTLQNTVKRDYKKLEDHEKDVVNALLDMGKDVYINPEAKGVSKQFDFIINDWYKVELKTAFPSDGKLNVTSARKSILEGVLKQGADVVIYDLTFSDVEYDIEQIYQLDREVRDWVRPQTGKWYDVQVWTNDGIYYFDRLAPDEIVY